MEDGEHLKDEPDQTLLRPYTEDQLEGLRMALALGLSKFNGRKDAIVQMDTREEAEEKYGYGLKWKKMTGGDSEGGILMFWAARVPRMATAVVVRR